MKEAAACACAGARSIAPMTSSQRDASRRQCPATIRPERAWQLTHTCVGRTRRRNALRACLFMVGLFLYCEGPLLDRMLHSRL